MATASRKPSVVSRAVGDAAAFDQGVRNQRRPVDDGLQPGRINAFSLQQPAQPLLDGYGRVIRCCQDFPDGLLARGVVYQDEVRERSADVYADAVAVISAH